MGNFLYSPIAFFSQNKGNFPWSPEGFLCGIYFGPLDMFEKVINLSLELA
jgi:hypothetical protein